MKHAGGLPKRAAIVAIIFLLAGIGTSTGRASEMSTAQVVPQVQEGANDLTKKYPSTEWKPGDPVRVVPDLIESGKPPASGPIVEMQPPQPLKPIVHPPVTPEITEQRADQLSTVKPYQEGDPVRIVPDLTESDGEN